MKSTREVDEKGTEAEAEREGNKADVELCVSYTVLGDGMGRAHRVMFYVETACWSTSERRDEEHRAVDGRKETCEARVPRRLDVRRGVNERVPELLGRCGSR